MRKLTIFEHISLDGVIQLPTGRPEIDADFPAGDWTGPFRGPEGAEGIAAMQGSNFDLILGRVTYDIWSKYWPTVEGGPFAPGINGATKYLATHRPDSLEWGPVEAISGDIAAEVRRIKSEDGRDLILWGSSTLTTELFERGLVDEVVLIVYPVLIGTGKRIFSGASTPSLLKLVSTLSLPTGVRMERYAHVGRLRS